MYIKNKTFKQKPTMITTLIALTAILSWENYNEIKLISCKLKDNKAVGCKTNRHSNQAHCVKDNIQLPGNKQ